MLGRVAQVSRRTPLVRQQIRCLSLTEPLSQPSHNNAKAATPSEPAITTLENGMRVVSVENGSPVSGVAVFIDAGSRHENHLTNGTSHFLETMAFKSTQTQTPFSLVRSLSERGANIIVNANRDYMLYSAESLREHTPYCLEALRDIIYRPALHDWEIEEAQKAYEQETEPDVMDAVHAAAYHNTGLGLPLVCTRNVPHIDDALLAEYRDTLFTPDRVVLAGVGVEHAELADLAKQFFGELEAPETKVEAQPAQYVGGEVQIPTRSEATEYVLAFETANWHSKDLIPMTVLQMIMGGGGSFSAGGPGKGLYSRLFEKVLNQNSWLSSISSFNAMYSDSAIFGLHGVVHQPEAANELAAVLVSEAKAMAGNVSEEELARAKNQLRSSVSMHLESRPLLLEDLGRQTQIYGNIQSAASIAAKIDAVTEADIQRVASNMLKSKPSVAATGNLSFVPRYDSVKAALQ